MERHRISCDIYAQYPYNFHDIKQRCTMSMFSVFSFPVFFSSFRKYLHADNIKVLLGIKKKKLAKKNVEFNVDCQCYHLAMQHIPQFVDNISWVLFECNSMEMLNNSELTKIQYSAYSLFDNLFNCRENWLKGLRAWIWIVILPIYLYHRIKDLQ